MHSLPGSHVGPKRLELAGSGAGKALLIGALVLIIVAGLGLAAWSFFGEDDLPAPGQSGDGQGVHYYKCARDGCGHEFAMTARQREEFAKSLDPALAGRMKYLPHCPKCQAPHACVRMFDCPQCGKKYVPFGVKTAWTVARGSQRPSENMQDVCPHCNANVAELRTAKIREQWKKNR